jgi:hypothetical protein
VEPRGIRATGLALVVAGGLVLSGCGILGNPLPGKAKPTPSASVAGSPSAAAASAPEAGQCHANDYAEQISMADDTVIDCGKSHWGETVYVGRFLGAAATGSVPLLKEGATGAAADVQNQAYQDCAAHADAYLGHSWIHPLATLRIVLPDDTSWSNGDRWYRCDLYELDWASGDVQHRMDSFKTLWFPPTCFDVEGARSPQINCAEKHPDEFVGGFMLPATLKKEPKTDKELAPYYDKCWRLIADYLGVTRNQAKALVGVEFWWQYDDTFWASGRRAGWCYTWTGAKKSSWVTGSAKGRKGKGL